MLPQIVIDTNVIVAAMRSREGASFALLSLLAQEFYEIHLSVPLVTEYRDVLARFASEHWCGDAEADAVISDLCTAGHLHRIFFLWRSFLPDHKDDLLLELAVAASAQFIVTHNHRHFPGVASFGIQVVSPLQFLALLGDHE